MELHTIGIDLGKTVFYLMGLPACESALLGIVRVLVFGALLHATRKNPYLVIPRPLGSLADSLISQ
jgi:hypothetical protein